MEPLPKVSAAESQMRAALAHFRSRDFASAITLAGAAGEILGSMLKASGQLSTYDQDREALSKIRAFRGEPGATNKEANLLFNGARNALKHYSGEDAIMFSLGQEATNMLHRCISDFVRLTGSSEPELLEFLRENHPTWEWE